MRFLLVIFSLLPFTAFSQLDNSPDQFDTETSSFTIQPIVHGSLAIQWNDNLILVDPSGDEHLFAEFQNPDMVLITHAHGDHFNPELLNTLNAANAILVVPESVAEQMTDGLTEQLQIMGNGESISELGLSVTAVPMYNLPEEDARHPKGWGNGYIITIDDQSIYISGDTEDIKEMRTLSDIDIAFVCMNLPYTMDIQQAASAVLDFKPTVIYPYHHRGQDIHAFKSLVDAGGKNIEVRLKNWYPE